MTLDYSGAPSRRSAGSPPIRTPGGCPPTFSAAPTQASRSMLRNRQPLPCRYAQFFTTSPASPRSSATAPTTPSPNVSAYLGSRAEWEAIGGWDTFCPSRPNSTPLLLDHGYGETLSTRDRDVGVLRAVAAHRDQRDAHGERSPAKRDGEAHAVAAHGRGRGEDPGHRSDGQTEQHEAYPAVEAVRRSRTAGVRTTQDDMSIPKTSLNPNTASRRSRSALWLKGQRPRRCQLCVRVSAGLRFVLARARSVVHVSSLFRAVSRHASGVGNSATRRRRYRADVVTPDRPAWTRPVLTQLSCVPRRTTRGSGTPAGGVTSTNPPRRSTRYVVASAVRASVTVTSRAPSGPGNTCSVRPAR